MLQSIKRFTVAPEPSRQHQIFRIIILGQMFSLLLLIVYEVIALVPSARLLLEIGLLVFFAILYYSTQHLPLRAASLLLVLITWIVATLHFAVTPTAAFAFPTLNAYLILIIVAAVLIDTQAAMMVVGASIAAILFMAQQVQTISVIQSAQVNLVWIVYIASLIIMGFTTLVVSRSVRSSLQDRQDSENALQRLNEMLQLEAAEHIRTRNQLQIGEDNLKLAQSIARLGNFEFDLQTRQVTWSDEVYRIFEIEPGTPITLERYQAAIHPRDFERVMKAVEDSTRSKQSYEIEHDLMLPSGTLKHLLAIGNPVMDEAGEVIRIFGIVQDITERKQVTQALSRERNLLRTLIDAIPDHIYVKDSEYRFVLNNVTDMRSMGASSAAEVIGKTDFDMYPAELAEAYRRDDQQVIEKGIAIINREEVTNDVHGNPIWVTTTKIPLRDENGRITGLVGIGHDISQTKHLVDELAQSREMLQLVMDSIPQAILWKDRQGVYLGYNRTFAVDTGLSRLDEAIGKTDFELVPESEAHRFAEEDRAVMETNTPRLNIEQFVHTQDGRAKWLRTNLIPMHNRQQQVTGLLVTYEDITERKMAEQALEESREMLRLVMDTVPQAILWKDRNGVYLGYNRTFAMDMGLSRLDEAMGKTDQDFLPAEIARELEADDRAIVESGIPRLNNERQAIDKQGRLKWLRSNIIPMKNRQQQVSGILITYEDITERKTAEQALAESRTMLRLVMDTVPLAIAWKDRDCVFLGCNQQMATDLELPSPEWIIGKTDYDLPSAVDAARFQADDRAVMTSGQAKLNYEEQQTRPDGKIAWLRTSKIPMQNAEDQVIGVLVNYENITERKLAEQALGQSYKLLEAIINNIPIRVFWKDRNGVIMGYNFEYARRVTPPLDASLIGKCDYDLFESREIADELRQRDQQLLSSGQAELNQEHAYLQPNGATAWWVTNRVPLRDQNGEAFGILVTAQDITERKLAEQRIVEANTRLQLVLDTIPVGVIWKDIHSVFQGANRRTLAHMGMERVEELIGKRDHDFFPNEADSYCAGDQWVIKEKRPRLNQTEPQTTRDGRQIWLRTNKAPLQNAEGEVSGVLITYEDITDQKLANEALANERNLLQTIINNLPIYIFAKDRDGRFTLSNNSHTAISEGQTTEHLIGKTSLEVYEEPYGSRFYEDDMAVLRDGKLLVDVERITRDANRVEKWVLTTKVPLRDDAGTITGMVGLSRDITEQKRSQMLLRERYERIELMTEIATNFIRSDSSVMDRLINRTLERVTRFTRVERGYVFLLNEDGTVLKLGYEWCETDVRPHLGVLDSVLVADFADFVASMKAGTIAQVQTADIPDTPDNATMLGVLRLLSIQSFINIPILVDQQFIGWIGFDATREPMMWSEDVVNMFKVTGQIIGNAIVRQRANVQIRQLNTELERRVAERTRQLEAANHELESFSYSVSHDLRAPLRSIDGFSRALLEDYSGKLDETGTDYLQRVRSGSQRMGNLIDDLLKLSRVTRNEIKLEPVNLSEMVQQIADDLQQSYPTRVVEWTIEPDLTAQGDRHLVRVALDNLIGNAWKFTSKVEQTQIVFGLTTHDNERCFFVRDNGDGFDMTYASKLFGAFQRLHSMTEFEGTGVGLATVQRVIHRHGGRIWAEGQKGQGATFFFTLSAEQVG